MKKDFFERSREIDGKCFCKVEKEISVILVDVEVSYLGRG